MGEDTGRPLAMVAEGSHGSNPRAELGEGSAASDASAGSEVSDLEPMLGSWSEINDTSPPAPTVLGPEAVSRTASTEALGESVFRTTIDRHIAELESHRTAAASGDVAQVHQQARAVREFWDGLDADEREQLLRQETRVEHQTRLGDLDGLPAGVRID